MHAQVQLGMQPELICARNNNNNNNNYSYPCTTVALLAGQLAARSTLRVCLSLGPQMRLDPGFVSLRSSRPTPLLSASAREAFAWNIIHASAAPAAQER